MSDCSFGLVAFLSTRRPRCDTARRFGRLRLARSSVCAAWDSDVVSDYRQAQFVRVVRLLVVVVSIVVLGVL